MRRIVLLVSALAANPAFAQYYGYSSQPYVQPQYQQQYYQQPGYAPPQQYYQQPQYQQTAYQQPYQQPYQQAAATSYDQQYAQQYYAQQGQQPIAQSQINPAPGLVNTDYLTLNIGFDGIVDSDQDADFLYGIEYRYKDVYYGLRPTVGFQGDNEGSAYAYAGIAWDLPLGIEPWIITPMTAIGAYHHGKNGIDLGSGVEFRSAIEVAYEMENHARVSALFGHMSNASIGNKNPGTEIAEIGYHIPLHWAD